MSFIQNLFNRPSDSPQTELWPASGIHQPVNPAEEEAFATHCQKRIAKSGRIGAALALGVTVGWWPLDLLIYRNVVEAQGPPFVFRFSITASAIFFLLLPHRNPWVLRHVFWLLLLPVCCIMVGLGYSGGFLGGLGKPWSYLALPTMCATMMFPLPFRLRLVMTGAQGLSWVAGLLLFFPSNLRSPYLAVTISILVLVIVYSMLMGHYMTVLLRDNFRQSLALARNAEELEHKVAEKTQTLRDLLNKLEKAREEERARISRDLHDELGQELTALRYALGLLTERFRRDPASIARNLGEIDHLLQRTNRTVRSLVGQLRPLILDDLGLKAAIEWLLQRSAERTGLTYEATLQGDDSQLDPENEWKVVTQRQPTADEWAGLHFGWRLVRHVKSNAIIFAAADRALAIGAGQMSRIDSTRIAVSKARSPLQGSAVASDAFFPFRDGLDALADAGATAVIQPGGSVRDDEVIAAANERGIAMVFTGRRHFKHG